MHKQDIEERIRSVPRWYHRIEVAPGIVTPGTNNSQLMLANLNLPANLSGLRALDIGARDGFFSFELERRGAEVTAVDYVSADQTGFNVAADLLGSKVQYFQDNVYRLTPEKYGAFDIVLCLGVLYHLPDPLGALDIIRGLCKGSLILETYVIDKNVLLPDGKFAELKKLGKKLLDVPLMQFFPDDTLLGDRSNWWGPNLKCVELLLEQSGFRVKRKMMQRDRAYFWCSTSEDPKREYHLHIARGIIDPSGP